MSIYQDDDSPFAMPDSTPILDMGTAFPDWMRGDSYEGPLADAQHAKNVTPTAKKPPVNAPGSPPPLRTYSIAEIIAENPQMREPVIHGLLRVGETMNIIAAPKTGKSWLATSLAFAVATGTDWLGFSAAGAGNVLIVDNELHTETLASRLARVAEATGIDLSTVADHIDVLPLRGRLRDIQSIGEHIRGQIPGRYRLVIIDAWYRSLPIGTDENDNAMVAGLYNLIDQYADHLRGSFVLIHHASKGAQGDKKVTDVGSGAGSQSRAADTHLVLRAHAEPNVVVADAVVRSFPPISPRCLRWEWPVFSLAEGIDPDDLLGRTRRPKQDEFDKAEAADKATAEREAHKAASIAKNDADEDSRLLSAIDRLDPTGTGAGYTTVRTQSRLNTDKMQRAVMRLTTARIIEETTISISAGNGAERTVRALRRRQNGTPGSSGFSEPVPMIPVMGTSGRIHSATPIGGSGCSPDVPGDPDVTVPMSGEVTP